MAERGWDIGLGRKLGLNKPVEFTAKPDGHFVLHIPCAIDGKTHNFTINKKLPVGVILKKLQQRDWDVTKGRVRCPLCVHSKITRELLDPDTPMPEHRKELEQQFLDPKDVKYDDFRASGPGGQHVNTTNSAIRATHIPTGITAKCQSHRSQHHNKKDALAKLTERVFEHHRKKTKEVKVPLPASDEVRFGISPGSIILTIPRKHELFDTFVDDNNKPRAHWRLELRANPNLKSDPFIGVVKAKIPPGKQRMTGAVGGSYNKQTDSFMLTVQPHLYSEIVEKFGTFRAAEVKIRGRNGSSIDLELPPKEQRKPVILRGSSKMLEEQTKPPAPEAEAEAEAVVEETQLPPEPQLPAEAPAMAAPKSEAPAAMPPIQFPRRLYLEPVHIPLDIDRAIKFLNDEKRRRGGDLTFRMEEGGYISYFARGGHGHR